MNIDKYLNEATGITAKKMIDELFKTPWKPKPGSRLERDYLDKKDLIVFITEINENRELGVSLYKPKDEGDYAWVDPDDLIPVKKYPGSIWK